MKFWRLAQEGALGGAIVGATVPEVALVSIMFALVGSLVVAITRLFMETD